jgi:DNA-binding NtrC family response regulator
MVKILKKECPDIKTVVMSGYADNVIINKDVLESDITFINKPLLPVSLVNRLRSVLDGDNKKKTANP